MKKYFFILFLSYIGFTGVNAQTTPDEINDKFFKIYADKAMEKAFEYLALDDKLLSNAKEYLDNSKSTFTALTANAGVYTGFELESKVETVKCIVKYNFIMKYENAPFKLTFVYYKPKDKWKMLEIYFTNQATERIAPGLQLPFRNRVGRAIDDSR